MSKPHAEVRSAHQTGRFPRFLRAFNSRNYRLFFAGQGISLTGNWMATTALSWLGYELSGSAFVLGLLLFANQVPVLLLGPVAGVWSDRVNRRLLLLAINAGCALQAGSLAAVTLTGHATVPWLLALALVRGLLNAVEYPTRQSFIFEMLDAKADLPNAIALNSSMFNVARLIGPPVAGFLIVARGPGACFLIDAVSYLPILASLLAMRLRPPVPAKRRAHPVAELRAGVGYAWGRPVLRSSLLMVAATALVGFAATVLAPVFVRDVFHADARTLGRFYGAMGVGALLSAIFLTTRTSVAGLGAWINRGAVLVVIGLAGYAMSNSAWLSLACLVVNGMGAVLVMAGNNTLLQEQVDDDRRGLVMGLFVMGQGMFPLGSLAVGAIASAAGPRIAIATCAGIMAAAAWRFARSAAGHTAPAAPIAPAPEAPPS
jgi:MFS family permease